MISTADRADAAQYAFNKYQGTAFAWGSDDCLHLARTVLIKQGAKGLPKVPAYKSELTAIRRLKRQGFETLPDLLGSICTELPLAMAITGDLATVPGKGSFSAIIVCAGNSWLGWNPEEGVFGSVTLAPGTPIRVFRYYE